MDAIVQRYLVPTVRAAVKLPKHDPDAAIDLLSGTVQSGDGRSAAGEFQKLIDNPGLCWGYITGPLARLQLGRAEGLMGDNAPTLESYEGLLNIWKDADPDLPVYRPAKAEYAQPKI
jgi:eukaryotic-like serine/threonine-protein kinase